MNFVSSAIQSTAMPMKNFPHKLPEMDNERLNLQFNELLIVAVQKSSMLFFMLDLLLVSGIEYFSDLITKHRIIIRPWRMEMN